MKFFSLALGEVAGEESLLKRQQRLYLLFNLIPKMKKEMRERKEANEHT